MKDYAVFTFYKPVNDSPQYAPSYLFNTEKAAQNFLQQIWEDSYNTALAEDKDLNQEECYHEDDYAQIEWNDGGCMHFVLSNIQEQDTDDKNIRCETDDCHFWCDGNCLYGGTGSISPQSRRPVEECESFEPDFEE